MFARGYWFVGLVFCIGVWAAAGCEDLKPKEGQYECIDDDDCPPDWVCNSGGDGRCYTGNDPLPAGDAGAADDTDTDGGN
jgi:hypothetical protein